MYLKRFYLCLVLVMAFVGVWAQDNKEYQLKSALSYKIAQNINWPNHDNIDSYRFGVLTQQKVIAEEFARSITDLHLHKKPIQFFHYRKISDIGEVQILFLDKDFSNYTKAIYDQFKSKPVLIFSDLTEDKKNVMVNYYVQQSFIKFEINKANIINSGLTVNPDVILLGGTEIDVASLYKTTQESLVKEREKVNRQQLELDELRKEIDEKKIEISSYIEEIKNHVTEIENQQTLIDNQKKTLLKLNTNIISKQQLLDNQMHQLDSQILKIAELDRSFKLQEQEITARSEELKEVLAEISEQKLLLAQQKKVVAEQTAVIKSQKHIIYVFILFIGLIGAVTFLIFRNYLAQKQFNRKLNEKNDEISHQREELQTQTENLHEANIKIRTQRNKLELLYNEMQDSITAAKVFQESLLPPQDTIRKYTDDLFILNLPKNIVSGDFYWFDTIGEKYVIAVGDCTGHGVSGAFMSITGIHLLNNSLQYLKNNVSASGILNQLNSLVEKELHSGGENPYFTDGMDIALCIIDNDRKKLQYAGAKSPVYVVRNHEIIQITGSIFSIGMTINESEFVDTEIDLEPGDIIYMFSDGYADQIGGENGCDKFFYKRFRETILEICEKPMKCQQEHLMKTLMDWKKNVEQLDDIMVIGIRV